MPAPKERMLGMLSGDRQASPPVVLHSCGDYKIELAGCHPKFQHYLGGSELADIERNFYRRFEPDWLHLGSAPWRGFWNRPRRIDPADIKRGGINNDWVECTTNW